MKCAKCKQEIQNDQMIEVKLVGHYQKNDTIGSIDTLQGYARTVEHLYASECGG